MVRKRSRRYESDDNDSDSDADFNPTGCTEPAQKKYSLRERKRVSSFAADFDCYEFDEDDPVSTKGSSDDEDFEVQVDGTCTYYESESQNPDHLIDYEDVIRADIVVNKQHKIDYDNLIQKTEIKIVQPKKRGRKPKNQSQNKEMQEELSYVCEPDLDNLAQIEDQNGQETELPLPTECTEGLPNNNILQNSKDKSESTISKDESTAFLETSFKDNVIEEEEDDVIVLGELKQEVIVLDD